MGRNLTEGSITKNMLIFALPMIAGNLLQQCYNLIDTWVVGRYISAEALSAVGSAYSLMTFINSIIIGLCMGCGAIFSFYNGKKDKEKEKEASLASFALLSVIAIVLTVVTEIFVYPILSVLNTPKSLITIMHSYLVIVFVGILFVYLYNYFAFLLRARGDSTTPLIFLVISSVLNIILDIYMVVVCNMGIEGAAYATVISQAVSGVGLWIYTWIKNPIYRFSVKGFLGSNKPFKEIFRYSLAASAQQSVMNFGILMVQGLVNTFGVSVMAAFAAGVKIDTLAYMPAQEFGNAYSLFVSGNYGANKADRIKKGTKSATVLTVVFCAIVSLFIFIFAKGLLSIFIDTKEVKILEIGIKYLRIEGTFYFLIGILFLLYGYFRGVKKPEISLILTIVSLGTRVFLAYILASLIGVVGIWLSIPIGWILADGVGMIFLRKIHI